MLLVRGARQGATALCSRCSALVATTRLPSMTIARSSGSASLGSGGWLLLSRGSSISLHSRDTGSVGAGRLLAVDGDGDIWSFDGRYLQLAAHGTRLRLLLCHRRHGWSSSVVGGSSWELQQFRTCSS